MAALRNLLSFSSSFSQLAIRSASTSRSLSTFRPRFQTLASRTSRHFSASPSSSATMQQVLHGARRRLPKISKVPLLENHFQKKGVCSKVYTTKPKKPNSAVRKVARVKLSTGESTVCYIPGEGHNLQEHSVVMVRGGRVRDLPGVRYKLIRGAQDLGAVAGRVKGRSKYGAKKPKTNK